MLPATDITSADKMNALLASYSAGSLSPAMQALVIGHLELSKHNHGFVAALDGLQGEALLDNGAEALLDREACLSAIFSRADVPEVPLSRPVVMPLALRNFVGTDLDAIKWRSLWPGIKECRLGDEGQGGAVLYWIKAGRKMPSHTHDGSEATLVLSGAFSDKYGRYGRGDVAIADADVDHQPVVDKEGDCICFAVTDAPLRLTGPIGRVLDRLFGHH